MFLHLLRAIRIFVRRFAVPALRDRDRARNALAFRLALEELGGAWIKLGQALALRFDLLPEEYCYELFRLLDRLPAFPYVTVRTIVEEDLNAPLERMFFSFEVSPFAAASIGQVHRAVLMDGTHVAVKIRRPGIVKAMRRDLRAMALLARILDGIGVAGGETCQSFVDELARWIDDELDFTVEARHGNQLAANSEQNRTERIARVFMAYSATRVITTELLDGTPLIEVIGAIRRGDDAFLEAFASEGHDLGRVAEHFVWNSLNQIYRFGLFHADVHPANLIVMEDDVIGYVDFGIVARLDDVVRQSLAYYASQLFAGRVDRAVDELLRWISPSGYTNLRDARADLSAVMEEYIASYANTSGRRQPVSRSANFEIGIMKVIRRHSLVVSPNIVLYLKTAITGNSVIFEIAPDLDLANQENQFFGRLLLAEARRWLDPPEALSMSYEIAHRVGRALGITDSLQDFEFQAQGAAEDVRRRLVRFRLAAAAAGAATVVIVWNGDRLPLADVRRRLLVVGTALVAVGFAIASYREGSRLPRRRDSSFPRDSRRRSHRR